MAGIVWVSLQGTEWLVGTRSQESVASSQIADVCLSPAGRWRLDVSNATPTRFDETWMVVAAQSNVPLLTKELGQRNVKLEIQHWKTRLKGSNTPAQGNVDVAD